MGEVVVRVKLSNLIDLERAAAGEPVTVRSVIPERVARELGLRVGPGREVGLADSSRKMVGVARGLVIEILGREVEEEAFVLGDEVLIGQTTLEVTALVVDCANGSVYPNPANPDGVLWVR